MNGGAGALLLGPTAAAEVDRFRTVLTLTSGFAFHMIVGMAPRVVRDALAWVGVEVLWLRPTAAESDDSSLAPARFAHELLNRLDQAIALSQPGGRPIVLDACARPEREATGWLWLFRRLNERRNGVMARCQVPLMLAVSPEMERLFAAEAPDFWSCRGSGMRLCEQAFSPVALGARAVLTRLPRAVSDVTARRSTAEVTRARDEVASARAGETRTALATALSKMRQIYCDLGRLHDAEAAAEEEVELYRALGRDQPDVYRTDLATALRDLASVRQKRGALSAARAAAAEAVMICRQIPGRVASMESLALARALETEAAILHDLADDDAAQKALNEAVAAYRELAALFPTAFAPSLAMALRDLAECLADLALETEALERAREAMGLVREAIALYRGVLDERFVIFVLGPLVESFNDLTQRLGDLGFGLEALAATDEVVAVHRALCQSDRSAQAAFGLASTLVDLSIRLADVGRLDDAQAAVSEAIVLFVALLGHTGASDADLWALTQDLARAHGIKAGILQQQGELDAAKAAASGAVTLLETAAKNADHKDTALLSWLRGLLVGMP
jgi:tetratricopeptide (TPR) repeat protein